MFGADMDFRKGLGFGILFLVTIPILWCLGNAGRFFASMLALGGFFWFVLTFTHIKEVFQMSSIPRRLGRSFFSGFSVPLFFGYLLVFAVGVGTAITRIIKMP